VGALRLYITKAAQEKGDGKARVYEIQVFARAAVRPRKLVFVAQDVPALGYRTYHLAAGEPAATKAAEAGAEGCENSFYRVTLAPGGLRGLHDKQLDRELLNTGKFLGGEVFTMLSVAPNNRGAGTDAGEFGAVPMPVMDASFDRVATHKPEWKLLEHGPVRTVYGLELPWTDALVRQRAVVWHSVKRVDCEVELADFNGRLWREFRMALPVAMEPPALVYEVPMGVVRIGQDEIPTTGGHAYGGLTYFEPCREIRPREVQNFVDASDDRGGLTLSSDVSVFDWKDPTGDPAAYPVLQPVLLASRRSCHGEGNWYPQAGDHRYRFSITSHAGGWRQGWKAGLQANHPLQAVVGAKAAENASLPGAMSFFSAAAGNLVIGTVKKAEDDDAVVLRCYDLEGQDREAVIECFMPVRKAERTDLLEEEGQTLSVEGGKVKCAVGHHAVETLKLMMQTGP
jgi:alpha-mannosidase